MRNWQGIKKILCIRPDNMGDVIMNGPAIRALRDTFDCRITLLTSSMGAPIARFMSEIDDVIVSDLPWVKADKAVSSSECAGLIDILRSQNFDAAVIFTVYSQNPLPSAMLAYLAGIPLRLAYCRENPYGLLTKWIPDREPYTLIKHQVERDLDLVRAVGAGTDNDNLLLQLSANPEQSDLSIPCERSDYIILHPSVSEEKRKYPAERWAQLMRELRERTNLPFLITGGQQESAFTQKISRMADVDNCHSLVGKTSIENFLQLINRASLLVSVNTSAVHIAAAFKRPVVVLYALTNPQHTPWKTPNEIFYFPVKGSLQSRNEVIRYVSEQTKASEEEYPSASAIAESCMKLLELTETEA